MLKRSFYAFASIFLLALSVIATGRPARADGYVYITQWGGPGGNGPGQLYNPNDVAVDADGSVYVGDVGGTCQCIQKFTSTGTYLTQWGTPGTGDGQFSGTVGVAVDASGNVYVADNGNTRIQKFTSTGTYITQWGTIDPPFAVAADAGGYVYDLGLGPIHKFTSTGTYITQWGTPGSGDGQFFYAPAPHGVAVDASGYVYVADTGNNRIQKFTSTGTYLTQWGTPGTGDGQFNNPAGVAVDASGYVYVADSGNNRVQKFGPASQVSVPGEAPLAFALDPVLPNPARGSALTVQFTLASGAPASLELLDVAGRRISAREVGQLGAGRHELDFGAGRSLAPGIYLVRLKQGTNSRVTRAAVLN